MEEVPFFCETENEKQHNDDTETEEDDNISDSNIFSKKTKLPRDDDGFIYHFNKDKMPGSLSLTQSWNILDQLNEVSGGTKEMVAWASLAVSSIAISNKWSFRKLQTVFSGKQYKNVWLSVDIPNELFKSINHITKEATPVSLNVSVGKYGWFRENRLKPMGITWGQNLELLEHAGINLVNHIPGMEEDHYGTVPAVDPDQIVSAPPNQDIDKE